MTELDDQRSALELYERLETALTVADSSLDLQPLDDEDDPFSFDVSF